MVFPASQALARQAGCLNMSQRHGKQGVNEEKNNNKKNMSPLILLFGLSLNEFLQVDKYRMDLLGNDSLFSFFRCDGAKKKMNISATVCLLFALLLLFF